MKIFTYALALITLLTTSTYSQGFTVDSEIKGTLKFFLMNRECEVDGFLLEEGIQVRFPLHMEDDHRSCLGGLSTCFVFLKPQICYA